jgi:hypothetical protein
MNRELYVALDESAVVAKCLAAHVGISAIEQLPAGGVRLVCMSSDGADTMSRKFKRKLITGNVVRQRHRPVRPLW